MNSQLNLPVGLFDPFSVCITAFLVAISNSVIGNAISIFHIVSHSKAGGKALCK